MRFTNECVKATNKFIETVKGLKYTGHTAYACPTCGSLKIRPAGSLSGWMTPAFYSCQECGYLGRVILEIEPDDNIESGKKK